MDGDVVLYSFWRSTTSWRIRIALNLKQIPHKVEYVNMGKDEHLSVWYEKINPSKKVPALKVNGKIYTESYAIIEFLEEQFQGQKLVPEDPYLRSRARAMALHVISGIQPLHATGVLKFIDNTFPEKSSQEWAQHWIKKGLSELEIMVQETYTGKYAIGDSVTIADITIIPQLYAARRNQVDLNLFPTLLNIEQECNKLTAFQHAHPDNQLDAVK